ncbi:MAG TPA: hypothetical protein VKA34_23665 [Balneolales bacterium]|nr:hypothetical protein [Balneolales bacterium]
MNKTINFKNPLRSRLIAITSLIIVSIALFTSCSSTSDIITKNTQSSILDGAKKVIVNSKLSADSLYQQTFNVLSNQGYTILKSAYKMHQVSAKGSLNPYGTYLIINILITKEQNGSKALLTGKWTDGWYKDETAEWKKSDVQRWKYSFAHIVKVAQQLNGNIMYSR